MREEWRAIPDFEGHYEVSNLGRIRSNKRKEVKILKTSFNRYGYEMAQLSRGGKNVLKSIHRLVAQAFLSDFNDNLFVDHIDNNKKNNSVTNLQMLSNRGNCTKDRKSLYTNLTGAHFNRCRNTTPWLCRIWINESVFIGYFSTPEEASAHYFIALDNYDLYKGNKNEFRKLIKSKYNANIKRT